VTRRGLLLFSAMCVIWGIPYLLIKVAVRDFSPATLVFCRTAIGAALLLPVAVARNELRPLVAAWKPLVVYTVVELAIPWVLLSTAEERLPSSLSGLLVAAVPLVGALIVRERLGARRITGLLVGLLGVAALVGFDISRGNLWSVAAVGVVVIGYATGPVILSRQLSTAPVIGVVAASLTLCALAYAPIALAQLPSPTPPARVIGAVVALGVICTALAFVLFVHLIDEAGSVRATVITYVNPAVAVVLGVVFLHEDFNIGTAIGFALILSGCYLATSNTSGEVTPAEHPSDSRPRSRRTRPSLDIAENGRSVDPNEKRRLRLR
jgi:drug/metabolite transporter (DMT)-like permease